MTERYSHGMVPQTEYQVVAADGRTLHAYVAGDPDGPAVFALHGTPGCGLLRDRDAADAVSRGLRLIGYDRPGYGGSARKPGRSVADAAADVSSIADHLDLDRFALWGASGGGPHALACAALLGDRLVACGVLASPAPFDAEGLDWLAGMGEMNAMELDILARGPEAHISWLREEAVGMLSAEPDQLREALVSLLSPVDREALTGELAEYLQATFRLAVANGVEGWHDESVAELGPWGFELGSIGIPVLLWHGEHDRFVPVGHGRWLAERIPGVEAHISGDDGHITLIGNRVSTVHAWLAERL
jgi:pimeloyl-ACP methyl ester carboxylesterase